MAEFNFLNYGRAAQAGENIQSSRLRNKALGMKIDAQENYMKNREKARQVRMQTENMPEAIERVEQMGLFDQADEMRQSYIKTMVAGVATMRNLRRNINKDNYDSLRQDLIQSGAIEPEFMPPEYSDAWFRDQEKRTKNKLQKLTRHWASQGVTFAQDFISDEFGDIRWEGAPYEAGSEKGSGSGGSGKSYTMDASDSNSIRKAIAETFYSDLWDPITQQIKFLNKEQSNQFAALTEESSKIYNENKGNLPHAVAVARAARKMNIDVPDLRSPSESTFMDDLEEKFHRPPNE